MRLVVTEEMVRNLATTTLEDAGLDPEQWDESATQQVMRTLRAHRSGWIADAILGVHEMRRVIAEREPDEVDDLVAAMNASLMAEESR